MCFIEKKVDIKNKNILITGGAGFIGKKLSLELSSRGANVVVFDCLTEQVHGKKAQVPREFQDKVKFIHGNILDYHKLKMALQNSDYVIHLAAETGQGQSFYRIEHYCRINILGTANLMDILVNYKHKVKKIILASTRTIYGEGSYRCNNCGEVNPEGRTDKNKRTKDWDLICPFCMGEIMPIRILENCLIRPKSIYSISKLTQEQLIRVMGMALKIPYTILRLFNVYGEGQALNNPYTGILSVFASRILNNKSLTVYEDGLMSRDFIHVDDVANAIILSIENSKASNRTYNVGSGRKTTILHLAKMMISSSNSKSTFKISGFARVGDVRHVVADIKKISTDLGFKAKINLTEGIKRFIHWMRMQDNVVDHSDKALKELKSRKLLRSR